MKGGLFRDTLLYVPAQLIGPFAQFAVVVVWTHLLAPGPFGVVAFVMASHELTATLGHSWWTAYMLRFRRRHAGADPARFQAMDDRMVAFAVASQVAMAPLALAAVGAAPSPGLVAASAAYLVARSLVAHYSERARADRRIGAYSLVQIVGPALGAALSLVALMRVEASATAALAAMALGQCVGVALLFAALRFAPGRGRYDSAILHEAFRFGWPLMATGAFLWAAAQGVRLVVGAFDGADAVGLFSAGWGLGLRIAAVIAMLCTAAAFPLAVDRIESGDRAGALRQVALNGTLMAA
ncbi:MAG: oligosaccharide flippase family protein, partial [Hyphomicrobiales bacterium]|nr:oligosaccharide flippase family protein [Hyphomicrobiales bacterium]